MLKGNIFRILFMSIFLLSGNIAFGEVVPLVIMDVKTVSEQLFFVTVRIETEKIDSDGESSVDISTGFIVSYDLEDGRRADFLVTGRHSIQNGVRGKFFFTRSREGKPSLGETYNIEIDDFENSWMFPEDDSIDVAVMPLAGIMRELSSRSWDIYYRGVSQAMSLGFGAGTDLDAIEEVVLIGYPSGIFDTKNFIPVARRGITATPLSLDFRGKHQFLIDSAIFPGSSGSPVFVIKKGIYRDADGKIRIGSSVIFLGMVSELIMRSETSQILNFGVVYKAPVIFDVIREVLSRANI
jgi:hypothetical protein